MVNYIKTTNGYFYKICKNGKKRISEDEYNKQTKIKKMMGGTFLNLISIEKPHESNSGKLMENVFLTGDITNDNSSIQRVNKQIMNTLEKIKNNRSSRNLNNIRSSLVYVGEIEYKTTGRSHVHGKSRIWIQLNHLLGKCRYYVEITKYNDTADYGEHVKVALNTLCYTKCNLIIEALRNLGINIEKTNNTNLRNNEQLKQEIFEIENQIESLNQELAKKKSILINKNVDLNSKCMDFNWTFSIQLPEENN
jgi:hypothetical protein